MAVFTKKKGWAQTGKHSGVSDSFNPVQPQQQQQQLSFDGNKNSGMISSSQVEENSMLPTRYQI